ncbi:MAG: hypothetical protein ACRD3W_07795 [Terriglobales bacterium]
MKSILKHRRWQILVSVPLLFYLLFAITSKFPESDIKNLIVEPTELFWTFFGLNQDWPLFAPDVRTRNVSTGWVLTFSDGTKTICQPPLNQYKWRKWLLHTIPWDSHENLWPDFAQYLGQYYYRDEDPPLSASLHVFEVEIPAPQSPVARAAVPYHTHYSIQDVYQYEPADLSRFKLSKPQQLTLRRSE